MNYIENIFICLAAPLLLAILCLSPDGRRGLGFLLAGMTSCLLSAYVSAFFAGIAETDIPTASHEIAPVVEEVIKFLPLLFYQLVFNAKRRNIIMGALLVAVGFATFENVCFLTYNDTSDLSRLLIRGFGAGAMHVVCGMVVATGLFFLWDQVQLQIAGTVALLCFVITYHAIFNVFANQSGMVFWVGNAIPLLTVLLYLLFFRKRVDM